MRQPRRERPKRVRQPANRVTTAGSRRGALAALAAVMTFICVGFAFMFTDGKSFLMPGPLSSGHVAIEQCSACHTSSGDGKLSWLHGLIATDSQADSKACLSCHKMPNTALNPHGADIAALKRRTERLSKVAARMSVPMAAGAQSATFPVGDMVERGLNCASCHQEHLGTKFDLTKMSNEQCRACHVVKFDSFDGSHPQFSSYPFRRRTRIVYDHASHFDKHFPEVAKKYPSKRHPATCADCHSSSKDRRLMAVAPFSNTCTTCHLDQITGKDRVSGPKGIAFLALPGLDVETLRKKKAAIGEWPDDSDARLTPFMKVLIGRNRRGRSLVNALNGLDLQDLSGASNKQIKAVTEMVWEIKGLFHELIKDKASSVLADLRIDGAGKLKPNLIAELTASLPRDVVVRAHQQWLPNLATEIAVRSGKIPKAPVRQPQQTASPPVAAAPSPNAPKPAAAQPAVGAVSAAANDAPPDAEGQSSENLAGQDSEPRPDERASRAPPAIDTNPQDCVFSLFGQCMLFQDAQPKPGAAAPPRAGGGQGSSSANFLGAKGVKPGGKPRPTAARGTLPKQQSRQRQVVRTRVAQAPAAPNAKASNKDDRLLFPSKEELRALGARAKEVGQPGQSVGVAPSAAPASAAPSVAAPAASPPAAASAAASQIEGNIDAESWAEYGGWYQQDYTVFYRPKGHKDRLIYSWLVLTGPQAQKGKATPATAVFDYLTHKDAQGSCTKCHSVDSAAGGGRKVNFSPPSVATKRGTFTRFIHEPHFSIMDEKGCLTCHNLKRGQPYLKSYEQGQPSVFSSNFSDVKIDLCQSCHTRDKARQDCLLCHTYHVNGVITPTINTRIPTQK